MSKKLLDLPVGALVKDTGTTYNGKAIVWKVLEHGHAGDPDGSTALISNKIITLKCFDAMESSNSDSNRRQYGNNRYLYSNLLQWLNSDAAAGSWYTAKHSADAAPTGANVYSNWNEYDQEAGFLTNISADLKNALLTTTKRTVKPSVDGGGYEDVSSKIFLLSNTEVGLTNESNTAEGSIYSLFQTSSERIAYPTAEAVSKSEYKDASSLTASKAWWWWLRTPYADSSYYARLVQTDGTLYWGSAYRGYGGARPAFAVLSSMLVSDSTDSDGAYTIQWNAGPTITTDSESLGDKNAPFGISFTIVDPDGDTATGKLYVDDTVKQNLGTVDQTKAYTYTFSATEFNALSTGSHTIKIEATDSMENTTSKSITFNKTASPIIISGTDEDLGSIWETPAYKYTVSTSGASALKTITEAFDSETTKTISNAAYNTEYTVDMPAFENLADETSHKITITATAEDGTLAIREITFTKTGNKISFYTDAIETDEAAKKIVVVLGYSADTDVKPDIKVEVTNNARAISPTWEDATEDVIANNTFHNFENKPIADSDFGVSVRVTVSKKSGINRVYVTSLGISYY